MALNVTGFAGSPSLNAILTAAELAGVEVAVTEAKPNENKSKPFLQKYPAGVLPVAETSEGDIYGVNTILRHIARTSGKLYGDNAFENTNVDQFLEYSITGLALPAAAWTYPIKEFIANNPAATNKAKGDIRKALGALNSRLESRTFLVGERISLADVACAYALADCYALVLDAGFRKQFAHTNRWFQTCVAQPAFKKVLGDFELCKKMAVAPAPPKAEPKKKQQEQQKKKAEPKAAAPKKAKAKNPLDELPPSKFNLEEWKRQYSNLDTRGAGGAIEWLWENFDAEGFSFWKNTYKYADEIEKNYMASNMVAGWLQRSDPVRKYGFGSNLIIGENGKGFEIKGVWIFRGQDVPAEMQETPDFDTYNFEKLDKDADKTYIEDMLAWDGESLGGKPCADGKLFK